MSSGALSYESNGTIENAVSALIILMLFIFFVAGLIALVGITAIFEAATRVSGILIVRSFAKKKWTQIASGRGALRVRDRIGRGRQVRG